MAALALPGHTRLTRDGRGVPGVVITPWLLAFLVLVTLFVPLSIAINANPEPSQDVTILRELTGWDVPGLARASRTVSFVTDNWPAALVGLAIVAFLWLIGMSSTALSFAIVGGIAGVVAFSSDYTLGELVARDRPFSNTGPTYPSGHKFGSTIVFGFLGYLAIYYRLRMKYLAPLLTAMVAMILAVGFSRMFEQEHWPNDVAADTYSQVSACWC